MKRKTMIYIVFAAIAIIIGTVTVSAQPSKDKRAQGKKGTMSLKALSKEPIKFELDIPYATVPVAGYISAGGIRL